MRYRPVLFEDHTAAGFRPLSWSVPVGELRCGVLNPRERVEMACGQAPVLLLRQYLDGLAADLGHRTGVQDLQRELARGGGTGLLMLSPRIGADWRFLEEVVQRAAADAEGFALGDAEGVLAAAVPATDAAAWLTHWQQWSDQAEAGGGWRDPAAAIPRWDPPGEVAPAGDVQAWRRMWDLVPATARALAADFRRLDGRLPGRVIWGAIPIDPAAAPWLAAAPLADAASRGVAHQVVGGDPGQCWLGPDCRLAPDTAIDTSAGPVILGAGVTVLPHAYLEGPLYIGSGSLVKAGAAIYGETSLGAVNKVAGEVGESTFLDLVNKQHEGFIGHAYLGSWCNLGALTTNSDLKNTYGTIRVDLGSGEQDTGLHFVGLMMAEHGKSAIGTMFNTGTVVGFASNVFGSGFPARSLPSWTWGDGSGDGRHDPIRAMATARTVMSRRGCALTAGHERIFAYLG
jgi:UDP-N-acetylglucosamine diphosphorylase/glucosamine-1-phosphate N-acetyltransferase